MAPATEYMLNTGLTLAVILLLAWLLVYAAKRWERTAPRGPLELLGTLRLEGRRAVYLVRIGERTVALGATEGGMIKVLELAEGELSPMAAPRGGFRSLVRGDKSGAVAVSPRAQPDAPSSAESPET